MDPDAGFCPCVNKAKALWKREEGEGALSHACPSLQELSGQTLALRCAELGVEALALKISCPTKTAQL